MMALTGSYLDRDSSPDPLAASSDDRKLCFPINTPSKRPHKIKDISARPETTSETIQLQDFVVTPRLKHQAVLTSPEKDLMTGENDLSPWRIRVTVQAERGLSNEMIERVPPISGTREIVARTSPISRRNTTTVPLKGLESSPRQVRDRALGSVKEGASPTRRTATPGPGRRGRRRVLGGERDGDVSDDPTFELTPKKTSARSRKTMPRKSTPRKPVSPRDISRAEDVESEARTVLARAEREEESVFVSQVLSKSRSKRSPNSLVIAGDGKQVKGGGSTTRREKQPYDKAKDRFVEDSVLESEGFSMVSIDSLRMPASWRSQTSHPESHEAAILESSATRADRLPQISRDQSSIRTPIEPFTTDVPLRARCSSEMVEACCQRPAGKDSDVEARAGHCAPINPESIGKHAGGQPATEESSVCQAMASSPPARILSYPNQLEYSSQQTPSKTFSSPTLPPPPVQPHFRSERPNLAVNAQQNGRERELSLAVGTGVVLQHVINATGYLRSPFTSPGRSCDAQGDVFAEEHPIKILSSSKSGTGNRREMGTSQGRRQEHNSQQNIHPERVSSTIASVLDHDVFTLVPESRDGRQASPKASYRLDLPGAMRLATPELYRRQQPSPPGTADESRYDVDQMSWQIDTPNKVFGIETSRNSVHTTERKDWILDHLEERQEGIRQAERASLNEVVVVEDESVAFSDDDLEAPEGSSVLQLQCKPIAEDAADNEGEVVDLEDTDDDDTDIWQVEARSSSLRERMSGSGAAFNDLFAIHDRVRPARGKIPSPWRCNGQVIYSDEPNEGCEPTTQHIIALPQQPQSNARLCPPGPSQMPIATEVTDKAALHSRTPFKELRQVQVQNSTSIKPPKNGQEPLDQATSVLSTELDDNRVENDSGSTTRLSSKPSASRFRPLFRSTSEIPKERRLFATPEKRFPGVKENKIPTRLASQASIESRDSLISGAQRGGSVSSALVPPYFSSSREPPEILADEVHCEGSTRDDPLVIYEPKGDGIFPAESLRPPPDHVCIKCCTSGNPPRADLRCRFPKTSHPIAIETATVKYSLLTSDLPSLSTAKRLWMPAHSATLRFVHEGLPKERRGVLVPSPTPKEYLPLVRYHEAPALKRVTMNPLSLLSSVAPERPTLLNHLLYSHERCMVISPGEVDIIDRFQALVRSDNEGNEVWTDREIAVMLMWDLEREAKHQEEKEKVQREKAERKAERARIRETRERERSHQAQVVGNYLRSSRLNL